MLFFLVSAATTAIKNEKALYTFNPKTISNDQISKWVKTGNLEQLEIATLMGKGKQLLGKTSWNDATRNYIKNVQNVMDDLDAVFKCVEAGDVAKLKTLLEKNIKYVFARDNQGRSPLQVAAQNGQKEVTQCIIAENAEYTQITDPVFSIKYSFFSNEMTSHFFSSGTEQFCITPLDVQMKLHVLRLSTK